MTTSPSGGRRSATAATQSDGDDTKLQDSVSSESELVVKPKRRLQRGRPKPVDSDMDSDGDGRRSDENCDDEDEEEREVTPARKKAAIEGVEKSRLFMAAVEGELIFPNPGL
jgi:hypothetical protein